jgi:exopolysaccharide biosynthesis polyprenyl glycosylphosphotransferase
MSESVSVTPSAARDALEGTLDQRTCVTDTHRASAPLSRGRGWLMRRMLLASDVLGLTLSFALAQWIYQASRNLGSLDVARETLLFALVLPIWVVMAKLYGLYARDEERTNHSTADEVFGVFHLVTVGTWLVCATAYVTKLAKPELPKLLVFWILAVVSLPLLRTAARSICRRRPDYIQNGLIVGAGDVGQEVARKLLRHPEYGINLLGFIDGSRRERTGSLNDPPVLGRLADLPALVTALDITRVVIASPEDSAGAAPKLGELRRIGVQVDIVPQLLETLGPGVTWNWMEGMPLIALPCSGLSLSSRLLKRGVDVLLSGLACLMLLPLFVLIAAAVWLDSGSPILYRRRILGRGGVELDAFKFRTMKREFCTGDKYGGAHARETLERLLEDPERRLEFARAHKLVDDPRITRVGRLLRRTSLDELPQLFNILVGQMSIVGPRMITAEELERYGDDAHELLSVRPGLTGYWQVNGRSSVDYRDRVRLDLAYIRGWSVGLDLNIMLRTVRVLLTAHGAR